MTEQLQSKQTIDTLISAQWLVTVDADDRVLEDHAIAILSGKIVEILPTAEANTRYQAQETVHLKQHALMPGLVNAHGHTPMTLFRGMADDYGLMAWLEEHIWPAEHQWVDEQFVKDGSELAIAEMLRSGTTCFSDMYFFPNITAEAAHQAGIRAQITFPIFDMASQWGRDASDYIHKGLQLRDDFKHSQFVTACFGPHAPYTNSDEPLRNIATLAAELECSIQMHLHETQHEVDEALQGGGVRPIQRVHELGLLTDRMQCVHMTALNDDDIELLVQTGASVIHCPTSNLKLASGYCPVSTLTEKGVNVALGTDGAASNNTVDLFSEMRTAAMLAKMVAGDAAAVPAKQALRMATINGAKAMGLEDLIGSLETGKQADIIAVDLSAIENQPLYHPESQLVYTACGHLVSQVWITGRRVVKDHQPTTLNMHDLGERANAWRDRINNA